MLQALRGTTLHSLLTFKGQSTDGPSPGLQPSWTPASNVTLRDFLITAPLVDTQAMYCKWRESYSAEMFSSANTQLLSANEV